MLVKSFFFPQGTPNTECHSGLDAITSWPQLELFPSSLIMKKVQGHLSGCLGNPYPHRWCCCFYICRDSLMDVLVSLQAYSLLGHFHPHMSSHSVLLTPSEWWEAITLKSLLSPGTFQGLRAWAHRALPGFPSWLSLFPAVGAWGRLTSQYLNCFLCKGLIIK